MEQLLLVSSGQGQKALSSMIQSALSGAVCITAESALECRSLLTQRSFDGVIINTPLPDEFGERLALELAKETDAGVLLLVRSELERQTEQNTASAGVMVLPKPLNKPLFFKSLRLVTATAFRLRGLRQEKDQLAQEMQDIRLISRAKGILMEYLSMTEPQAHKYLEKQAMDLRITKAEAARRLLSTYEF